MITGTLRASVTALLTSLLLTGCEKKNNSKNSTAKSKNEPDAKMTFKDWEALAIKEIPSLQQQGSPMHKMFIERWERLKEDSPDYLSEPAAVYILALKLKSEMSASTGAQSAQPKSTQTYSVGGLLASQPLPSFATVTGVITKSRQAVGSTLNIDAVLDKRLPCSIDGHQFVTGSGEAFLLLQQGDGVELARKRKTVSSSGMVRYLDSHPDGTGIKFFPGQEITLTGSVVRQTNGTVVLKNCVCQNMFTRSVRY